MAVFLLIESVLYYLILTTGGDALVVTSFLSIVVCFLFSLLGSDPWIKGALACTMGADFFLVVCSPVQRTWGMVFFLGAQLLYAVRLQRGGAQYWLWIRGAAVVLAEIVALLVLLRGVDLLAVISMCYYANLIVSIFHAFSMFRKLPLFSVALVLFLLCDTVIGLQVAAGTYLQIPEGSLLYRVIFMDGNLAWAFYLPSQVLIALSGRSEHGK